mgnify:CR=1 FL=1
MERTACGGQHECGVSAVCCMHVAGHLHKHSVGSEFGTPLPNASNAKHSGQPPPAAGFKIPCSTFSTQRIGNACVFARQTVDGRCCCTNIPACCMFVCKMLKPGLVNISCRGVSWRVCRFSATSGASVYFDALEVEAPSGVFPSPPGSLGGAAGGWLWGLSNKCKVVEVHGWSLYITNTSAETRGLRTQPGTIMELYSCSYAI